MRGESKLKNNFVITIDVDWMPDWCIREVANILIEKNIKATWFITHDSQEIRKLFNYPHLFEVGIHPNFKKGSTQGKSIGEVMEYLKKIAPKAISIRTHGLVQSSRLFQIIRGDFNMLYDVSLLLPETPNIIPHEIFFSKTINGENGLLRFPYFWEDDIEMNRPQPCFSFKHKKYHVPGLKIFDFHIIHIILNSADISIYNNCKEDKEIFKLSNADVQSYVNEGQGTGTLFREIVQFLSINNKSQTISDLAHKWRKVL